MACSTSDFNLDGILSGNDLQIYIAYLHTRSVFDVPKPHQVQEVYNELVDSGIFNADNVIEVPRLVHSDYTNNELLDNIDTNMLLSFLQSLNNLEEPSNDEVQHVYDLYVEMGHFEPAILYRKPSTKLHCGWRYVVNNGIPVVNETNRIIN